MDLLTELLKLGSVGVISGLFGAFVALRRHKHEKYWELRVSAYTTVIESLSDITATYEARNNNWDNPNEETEALQKELEIALGKVRKHRDMGGLPFFKRCRSSPN